MVTINLLPWRENKLKRKRRKLLVQTLGLLILVVICSGVFWAKNARLIGSQLERLKSINADNQQLFSHLEDFKAAQRKYLPQQQRTEKINQLISQRQIIPQLIAMLENKKLSFTVNYLLVNHLNIKLIGTDASSDSAMSLLNTLREESAFCQVIFIPFETDKTRSTVAFELQAQICNENIDQ